MYFVCLTKLDKICAFLCLRFYYALLRHHLISIFFEAFILNTSSWLSLYFSNYQKLDILQGLKFAIIWTILLYFFNLILKMCTVNNQVYHFNSNEKWSNTIFHVSDIYFWSYGNNYSTHISVLQHENICNIIVNLTCIVCNNNG